MRLPILENETIYGWITRYHLKVGMGHPKNTLLNLLGSNKVRIHPYLPNHLSALAKSTKTNSDFWLRGHTLYPLFEFFNREDSKKLEAAMLGDESNVIGIAGIPQSNLAPEFGHRYCPECIRLARSKQGFGIIDIRHQIPGLTACPEHLCKLNIIPCGDYGLDRMLTYAHFNLTSSPAALPDVAFSTYCIDTFENIRQHDSFLNLTGLYRHHLNTRGYLTQGLQLRYRCLVNDISSFYTDFSFSDGLHSLKDFHFLGPLLRNKTHTHVHPIKHLIFTNWLFKGDTNSLFKSFSVTEEKALDSSYSDELQQVVLKMLKQGESMGQVALSTGKSRCFIRRVCELHGIEHKSNAQATSARTRHAVVIQAQLGRHRKVIAQNLKLGIGYVEQVISNTKGLVAWRKKLAVLTKIKAAYLELRGAKLKHADWFRKDFKAQHNQAFFYLYHHARKLLEAILPKKRSPQRATLDWSVEDERLYKSITKLGDISHLSISAIGVKVKDRSHLRRNINKLPNTKALLIKLGRLKMKSIRELSPEQALVEVNALLKEHDDIKRELLACFPRPKLALYWLLNPKPSLSQQTPVSLLAKEPEQVMSVLIRMRTGDFS